MEEDMRRVRCRRPAFRAVRLAVFSLTCVLAVGSFVVADRASENMDPAFMYEKAGVWDKAAMYYHRCIIGLRGVYMAFHWDGNPLANAAGKYAKEYDRLPKEFDKRYAECLKKADLAPGQIRRMHEINDRWLEELIDQEQGGQRITCSMMAAEAERHGDFRLAEFMRRGDGRFARSVAIPYHTRRAEDLEKAGDPSAALHRQAVKSRQRRAQLADRIAKGHDVLRKMKGFGGKDRYLGVALHPRKVNPVSFQYLPRRLHKKDGTWIGLKPEEVARKLKQDGLTHAEADVRLSSVVVLGHLREKEAVLLALGDADETVRRAAAEALADIRWVDGWSACAAHPDPGVRAAVGSLVRPAGKDARTRTWVITALIEGLDSRQKGTPRFCRAALQKIVGAPQPDWSAWWKGLGDVRSGLTRTVAGKVECVDDRIDFGTWWQGYIERRESPLAKYEPPATITWNGYLAVTQPGEYRFSVRNCGEGRSGKNQVKTPGRMGFPGLYLSAPAATLRIDGKDVLPVADLAVQDPNGGIRIDFSEPLRLDAGLHRLELTLEYRSKRKTFASEGPCVRLYWSSDRFLRQVIPVRHLVCKDAAE